MMRKNILFLLSDSIIKPCGGLGERFKHLLPLIQQEHNCFVFCYGDGGSFPNIPVKGVNDYNPPFKGGQQLQAIITSYINEFIDSTAVPDIVVAADHVSIYPGFNIARYRGAKLVIDFNLALFSYEKQYNPNDLQPIHQVYSNYIREAEVFGIHASHQVVLCSHYYNSELPVQPKTPAMVIPNGIDLEPWTAEAPAYQFDGDFPYNLLFIGRLNTQKGIGHIINMKLPDDVCLHIAGPKVGSDLYDKVLHKCAQTNNMKYIGILQGSNKISAMKSADAILFPSLHEPFGIVFLEALAARTPLITTAIGEMSTALSEASCIKCEASEIGIEAAIRRLIGLSQEERRKLSDNGFKIVEKYDWKIFASQFIELFNRL